MKNRSADKQKRRTARKSKRAANRSAWLRGSALPAEFRFTSSDEISAAAGGGVEILAADAGAEADGPNLQRFKMRAYTGGMLDLPNYPAPVVVDLAGMRIANSSTPILRDHNAGQIVGHGRAVVDGGSLAVMDGVISGAGDDAAEVNESAGNGFPWESSIGARGDQVVFVDKGEKAQANGRTFVGPVYIARKSTLKEVSFVAIGADRGGASATLTAQLQGISEMNKFSKWLLAAGQVESDLSSETLAALKAAFDAQDIAASDDGGGVAGEADTAPVADVAAGGQSGFSRGVGNDGATTTPDWLISRRKLEAQEAGRSNRIRAISAQYGTQDVKVNAAGDFDLGGDSVGFVAHALQAGWSPEQAELAALRSGRPGESQSGQMQAGAGADSAVVEAALCLTLGVPPDVTENGRAVPLIASGLPDAQRQVVLNRAMEAGYRQFGLSALMDEVILAGGEHYRGQRGTDAFIKAAMRAERGQINAAGGSTISLSGILSNVANKLMLASFGLQETTWRQICGIGSNKDFKASTRYRLTSGGSFKKVGPDGDLKQGSLSEGSYSTTLETYGMLIALNRQMMVNDDLGAFGELPAFIGQEAATRVEEAVYVTLLSNPSSFFHADNKNLTSGGASALSVTSLSTLKTKFRNQVTSNGKPLLATPSILLTGTVLDDTARRLVESEMLLEAATAGSPTGERNPHKGTLTAVSSPYLNNTAITDQDGSALSGQSDTHWYMLTDPQRLAAMRAAFLNGQQVPTIESSDAEFETLGMKWRGFLDFGVGMEAPEAAQRSAGA
tara:strand:- start:6055 stop:8415 length:2361 start_codon:yes stop_codon:yes gene_type:complete